LIDMGSGPISGVMSTQRAQWSCIVAAADGWQWILSGSQLPDQDDADVVVEQERPAVKHPPLYKVVLHNDDYTPMEFVVEVLLTHFSLTREQAVRIMLTVHTRGKGVAGTYTREIAETKVVLVNEHARTHQHPLLCTMEQA